MNGWLIFHHANTGVEVEVAGALLFAYYYSQSHKCMFLLASGGAIIPVKESQDEIKAQIEKSKATLLQTASASTKAGIPLHNGLQAVSGDPAIYPV